MPRTVSTRTRSGAVAAALAAVLLAAAGAAQTATAAPAGSVTAAGCTTDAGSSAPATAKVARGANVVEPAPSRARLAAVAGEVARQRSALRAYPTLRTIPVHVHVLLTGTGAGDVPDARIARQVQVLTGGFSGAQSRVGTDTGYRFRLASVDRTRNSAWRTMGLGSSAERQAKQRLRRGSASDLNIYLTDQRSTGWLGWATFPWDYSASPTQDGVVIAIDSMPGTGGAYGLGDTAVHEVGHWLGLLHTFGADGGAGCAEGDEVTDTPAEAYAAYGCQTTSDTCAAPGKDPVHNFMDYSDDLCLTRFTIGQRQRMQGMVETYRL